MRVRSLAAISLAAVSALLLAGCAGSASPEGTPTPTGSGEAAAVDLCSAQAASGAATDALTVEGKFGETPTLTFDAPLEVTAFEAKTVSEGSGDPVAAGDFVNVALTAYDATTGEFIESIGYGEGELAPFQISVDNPIGQSFGCAPVGTRAIATFPAAEGSTTSQVYVIDLLEIVPTAAWGEDQDAVDGMPKVTLDDTGAPTIEIPEGDAPAAVAIAVLKQGDGATVETGDQVLVQYTGAKWSDGSVFDSSWQRGAPASFQTTGVVPGFQQALEGQKVGSQVLVVMPPAQAYGEDPAAHELGGETLVFVIDILGTQHAVAAAQ